MVRLSLLRGWGRLDLYGLPVFRERTFPGSKGRLRFEPLVDAGLARYEDGAGRTGTDVALRYAHYFGAFDLGISLFDGTSREPRFEPVPAGEDGVRFAPVYQPITQLGVDLQYTAGASLWKLESIVREGQGDSFAALVAGVEHTRFGFAGTALDLGVLFEFLYDGRTLFEASVTVFDEDVFYGVRLALNDLRDTSLLAGAVTDLGNGGTALTVEGRRRLRPAWTIELEARVFLAVAESDVLGVFERDSFLTMRFTRFF